jgi:hypothetical protein
VSGDGIVSVDAAEATTEPGDDTPPPTTVAPPTARSGVPNRSLAVGIMALGLAAMVVALFLPWASAGSSSEGLSQYGAPQPAIIAWLLIAIGLATSMVAASTFAFGGDRALVVVPVGAFAYLAGTAVWYVSSVLPSVVASGCNANGGPLCKPVASSPVIAGTSVGSGLVMAVFASLGVGVAAIVFARIRTKSPAEPQSTV